MGYLICTRRGGMDQNLSDASRFFRMIRMLDGIDQWTTSWGLSSASSLFPAPYPLLIPLMEIMELASSSLNLTDTLDLSAFIEVYAQYYARWNLDKPV